MKTFKYSGSGNKTARKLFMLAAIVLAFTACKKDDNSGTATVSDEEAAEVMVQAVDPASGGLVIQTDIALDLSIVNAVTAQCGISKDSTISKTYTSSNRSYSYQLAWNRLLTCTSGLPSSFSFSFSGSSSYSGPRMSSADSSSGEFTATGLDLSSPNITLNENYKRQGTQQSKVRDLRSFTTTVTITTTDLVVNKSSRQILSGSASISVTGTVSTGGSFTRSGTLTFLGGGKATLVLASGATYNIEW